MGTMRPKLQRILGIYKYLRLQHRVTSNSCQTCLGGGFVSVKAIPQQQLSKSRRVRSAKTRSVSPPFLCLCAWRLLINLEEIHPGMVSL